MFGFSCFSFKIILMLLTFLMGLHNNVSNVLWKNVEWFEMNIIRIFYSKTL
jgi:hypothetical protein